MNLENRIILIKIMVLISLCHLMTFGLLIFEEYKLKNIEKLRIWKIVKLNAEKVQKKNKKLLLKKKKCKKKFVK